MILYFLRHGQAGQYSMSADDDERTLTDAGVAALRAAAPLWQRINLRPDVVISSPLPRARETAELLAEGIGLARPPVADQRLLPGAGWGDMARAMSVFPEARRVMFVGHEPDLSSTVRLLTGAASVRMRKGALACVEFPGIPEPGAGELAWLLDPDLYEVAGDTEAMSGEASRPEVTRVGAYALCTDDRQRILLCRLADGIIKAGSWTLPGGGVEFGEPPPAAALRELLEETGLVGEITGLADVESFVRRGPLPGAPGDGFHAIQIVYRVRVVGGELRDELNGTTDAARWFARDELDDMPLVDLATEAVRLTYD